MHQSLKNSWRAVTFALTNMFRLLFRRRAPGRPAHTKNIRLPGRPVHKKGTSLAPRRDPSGLPARLARTRVNMRVPKTPLSAFAR